VALADDRLLTAWKVLTDWVSADREFLMWRQQMRAYLADWQRSGHDDGALLSGRLLSEADGWTLRRIDDLNTAELEYVESSRRPTLTQMVTPAASPPPAQTGGWRKVAVLLVAAIAIALLFVELSLHWFSGSGRPGSSSAPPPTSNPPAQTTSAPGASGAPNPDGPLTGSASPAPVDAAAVNALVEEGERLSSYGNNAGAQEAYSKAIQLDPNNEKAFTGLRRLRDSRTSAPVPAADSHVVLQYEDAADAARARALRETLTASLRPVDVQGPELIRGAEGGNVRYFFPEDRELAQRVKTATEASLKTAGYPVTLDVWSRSAKAFPNAKRGTVEVWLPPLVARLYVAAGDARVAKRMDVLSGKLRSPALTITVRQDPKCYSPRFRYVFAEDAAEAKSIAMKLEALGLRVPPPVLDKPGDERRRHFDLCVAEQTKR
jgi:tetratricopeptide (TPR) repeat protein